MRKFHCFSSKLRPPSDFLDDSSESVLQPEPEALMKLFQYCDISRHQINTNEALMTSAEIDGPSNANNQDKLKTNVVLMTSADIRIFHLASAEMT